MPVICRPAIASGKPGGATRIGRKSCGLSSVDGPGGEGCTNPPGDVWDGRYDATYHLGPSLTDSTSGAQHLADYGSLDKEGFIGRGRHTDPNGDEHARVDTPALIVFPERVRRNVDAMLEIAGGPERLRPHVKTHKMAEIVDLQVSRGIRYVHFP